MTAIRTRPAMVQGSVVAAGTALIAAGALRYGALVFAVPVAGVLALALLRRPRLAVGVLVTVVVIGERVDTGFFPFTSALYDPVASTLSPVECLIALALLAVVLDRLARGRPFRLAGPLAVSLGLVALAAVAGAIKGYAAGVSASEVVYAGRQLAYVVIVPLLVANVVETPRHARQALALGAGLALLKAVLGLVGVAAGRGTDVDGATITYYEPVANWLMLLVIAGVLAAVLRRAPLPVWLLAGTPLLVLSLALSYRRSFWIGAALTLLLVGLLGSRPLHRRLLVPVALMVAVAVWAVSAVGFQAFQAQGSLVERARSLQPSKLQVNAEDRYRIDERANVVAEVRRHPVFGLGLAIDWTATHPLPVEHENGRNYTHIVLLWWWLKLGVLGLAAYVAFVLACLSTSWRVWRRSTEPLFSAAGLAALCALVGLALVETTGSFTGVDLRFSVLVGAVAGLLAALRRFTLEPASPGSGG